MLKHQPWSLGSTAPALCPKCNTAALYRSHTHTTIEEKRKQYGSKRPFRCHECGWRGWVEESQLRYSSEVMSHRSKDSFTQDVAIPDIRLDDNGDLISQVEEEPWNEMEFSENSNGSEPEAADAMPLPEQVSTDAQSETGPPASQENGAQLPDFTNDVAKPVSKTVPAGFHHHSRHTVKVCPKCGEPSLYRSRSRSVGETIKKKLTIKRPYRCHKCGWRGWLSRGF